MMISDVNIKKMLKGKSNYLLILALLFALPLILEYPNMVHYTDVMRRVFVFGLFALSFDLLLGYTGLLNFGHMAFFGLGAYFTVYILSPYGWTINNFAAAAIIAMMVCIGAALLLALLVKKTFKGIPFTFMSLAFGMIIFEVWSNSLPDKWSGGDAGFTNYTAPDMIGSGTTTAFVEIVIFIVIAVLTLAAIYWKVKNLDISSKMKSGLIIIGGVFSVFLIFIAYGHLAEIVTALPQVWTAHMVDVWNTTPTASIVNTTNTYYVILIILVVTFFIVRRFINSPVGRVWQAIRENESRVEVLGYNLFKYKTLALATSAAIAGLAGALFTLILPTVPYETVYNPLVSIEAIIYIVVGGLGTLLGGPVGAGVTLMLEEILKVILPFEAATQIAFVVIGIVFILIVFFIPRGIVGTYRYGREGRSIKETIEDFISRIS